MTTIESILMPGERVVYEGSEVEYKYVEDDRVKVSDSYIIFITNKCILLYKERGILFKKHEAIRHMLADIYDISYSERGIFGKMGVLEIVFRDGNRILLMQKPTITRAIYKHVIDGWSENIKINVNIPLIQNIFYDISTLLNYDVNLADLPPFILNKISRLAQIYIRILYVKTMMKILREDKGKLVDELEKSESDYEKELKSVSHQIQQYLNRVYEAKTGVQVRYNIITDFSFKDGVLTLKCPNCGGSIDVKQIKNNTVKCKYCNSDLMIPKKLLELL
ncbi:MAG: hypothetical protein NDF54_06915 [archaeon GB-1867-035]|nr:hypothetical protein [Candidatus Culexmicrobium profundum]